MLQRILRPGSAFPSEVASDIDDVDAFLRDLDACLIGSAKVRALHLAEVKDHILERRDHALDGGRAEDDATRDALDMFGFAAEYGADQRAGLTRRFWQTAVFMGLLFGLMTLGLEVINRSPDDTSALPWLGPLVQGVLYGGTMGWFVVFVWPQKLLPTGDRFATEFVVQRSRGWRTISLLFAVGFALLGAVLSVAVFVPTVRATDHSAWGYGVLALLSLFNVRNILMGAERIVVDADGMTFATLWSKRRVPWSRLERVERLGDRHSWIPGWIYWSRVRVLQYRAVNGTLREAKVFPEVRNADRLIVLARDKIATRRLCAPPRTTRSVRR